MTLTNPREKLTAIAEAIREKTGKASSLTLDEMPIAIREINTKLIEDMPTTAGEWACLARASQMLNLNYVAKADIPTYEIRYDDGTLVTEGEVLKSLWYSSVRGTDWGFIGYGVSMYSLMTCLNNPKSFVYNHVYHDYFDDTFDVCGNVYGLNCTEFVAYCHDMPYFPVTNTFPHYQIVVDEKGTHNSNGLCWDSENNLIDTESLRTELKLCDFLNSTPEFSGDKSIGHAVLVTGIRRNADGTIQEVDITHATTPLLKKESYDWDSFVEMLDAYGYRPYRISTLGSVSFPKNLTDIVYSDIVTNRGDKVSIRPNQDITLNVLESGYAGIVLFKDGVQVNAQASTDDWELTELTTGKYTAILYKSGETVTLDSATENNSTSFIVCNVTVSNSGNIFSYTAEAVNGEYPTPMQVTLKDQYGYTKQVELIDGDCFMGSDSIEIVPQVTPSIIHVPFKTEYGFVIAECKLE